MEKLLTIKEVSEMMGVCLNTLRLWDSKEDSTLKAVRTPGGHRRWKLSDVKKAMGVNE